MVRHGVNAEEQEVVLLPLGATYVEFGAALAGTADQKVAMSVIATASTGHRI
jgi:hypothetical protein